eukprot:scaffold17539_cov76-Skeletonema_dohrnii-CCMP3373.AAC.2
MDDATFTSNTNTAAMNRHSLLEQLAIIRSLFCKESSAADDDAATAAARNRNVVEGRAKEGVRLINDQMAAVSTELLLTVMSDMNMMLLRLLDGLGLEEGRAVPSSDVASDQQLMLMDATDAAKKKRAAAATKKKDKKKRYKRNKAAAKQKNKNKTTNLMSWMGGGLISLITMVVFGSIMTFVVPLALIHQTDGSGEGNAPPALPPSASRSLRQKEIQSNNDNAASVSPDINLLLAAVVPPPVFSPSAVSVSNRRMRSDEDTTIERNALIDIYDSAKGAEWTYTTNWLDENANYCSWQGVTCDEAGHVTELVLANNSLSGRLSESIGNLTFIEVLDLSDNDMKGSIPTDIGLPKLRQFDMSSNALSGSLPEWFNNLPQLRRFDMSSNALSGELPGFAESILSLQELDLSNQINGFTGSIPQDLSKFQSLNILNLADNKLAGTIPPSIGKALLKILNLAGNILSSNIPPTIGNMALLEVLELSSNSLSGQIPFQIGQLGGTLKRLGLANNTLTGTIPSQLGQLEGASILLKGNLFEDTTAPFSLCMLHRAFDLANITTFCPFAVERNALSDFYDSAKGAEWTDRTKWLGEYTSYCDWKGVTCNNMNHVTELNLSNNGLSGRLSESIGNLSLIEVMDLSDNDMKGSIPSEIGLLSNLTYLRLSYNAFSGAVPKSLGELAQLQLLQLQSNRISKMPNIPQLDESIYKESTFVTDCGASAFDVANDCGSCTMCCECECYSNANVVPDFNNLNRKVMQTMIVIPKEAARKILIWTRTTAKIMVVLFLYLFDKRKNRANALRMEMDEEMMLEEDDNYALSRIGKDSVYSYFVTDKRVGWLAAFATLATQIRYYYNSPGNALPTRICVIAETVSAVYNQIVSKNNADLIVNSVIILFVMEMDERVFSALAASNEKWTAHADNSDSGSASEIEKMKEKIESQEKELRILHSQQREITLRMEEMKKQTDEIAMLWEEMHKMGESQASESIPQCAAKESITTLAAESKDSRSDTDAEKGYNE